ncbi:right-handed parallel beta-helix repeat-containing protein [Qaidamihabitans albus]|uniref:right-handed parallel beta-helix repeat-containing protein n=1 Tax=Qaidamihabitans albus TaxID=2795733 RepID=UPI0018F220CA|nr:right-handed parallel beta-helix repeat-containing protein [Qaidamihabitans albus]
MEARPSRRARRVAVLLGALTPLLAIACSPEPGADAVPEPKAVTGPGPVCGNTEPGPAAAPVGAVTVDPAVVGDVAAKTESHPPGTTFWLAPGTHRLGDGEYEQVSPKDGDTYLGAPGAVFDGRGVNRYALTGEAEDVTIRHLTVRGFVAPPNEGVVNHDSGDGWVIEHNTIKDNAGAGLMAGARQQVRGNCLKDNGQYGMNAYQAGNTITGLVVEGNEIVGNNTDDWEARSPGCGCTGGIKFWAVDGADIRDNWVHDNRGTALWADTNNNDFLIEGNLIEDNDGSAIFYETSYNAVIRDNTIRRNNWVQGKDFADRADNFPVATIYISESGGEPRVPARTEKIDIHGNVLEDNWSGITLWENADRFCNSPANTSSGTCTLLVPEQQRCSDPGIAAKPLYDDCRWKTQRVDIHDNRFAVDPGTVGCTTTCARMALLSNYGTYPDWSPYQRDAVQEAITFEQDNTWHDNTYTGPWTFMPYDTSRILDPSQWQVGPYRQDAGSTFARTAGG